jgi:hypothetical protein
LEEMFLFWPVFFGYRTLALKTSAESHPQGDLGPPRKNPQE